MFGFDMSVNVYDPFVDKKTIESFGGKKVEDLIWLLRLLTFYQYICP